MPLTRLPYNPSVIKDSPSLSAEPAFTDSNLMRWREVGGKVGPQKVGGWTKYSTSLLSGKARGGLVYSDQFYDVRALFGTHTNLYAIVGNTAYDVTPSGLSAGFEYGVSGGSAGWGGTGWGVPVWGGATGIFAQARTWSFAPFGSIPLAAVRAGALYEWDNNTSNLATVVTNSPSQVGGVMVTAERFVVTLGSTDPDTSTFDPMLVRWSDQGDRNSWTPSPTNVSGSQKLQAGTDIRAGVPSRGQNLIWTDTALIGMRYLQDTEFVYGFDTLGVGCGLIGPLAFAESQGVAFWMSNSGNFFAYDGGSPRILSCPVRDYVFDALVDANAAAVCCAINSAFEEVAWFYPTDPVTPECTAYVKYNYRLDKWDVGTLTRTTWLDRGLYNYPLATDGSTYVYQHEDGVDADGAAMNSYVQSAYFDLGDGDRVFNISRVLPDVNLTGTLDVTLTSKRWPQDSVEVTRSLSMTTTTDRIDTRIQGRQIAWRVGSDAVGDDWRLDDIRFDIQPTGKR
jgi:hypothetical protein